MKNNSLFSCIYENLSLHLQYQTITIKNNTTMVNKKFIFVDEYTYDGESEDVKIVLFATKELAEKALAERWEWYKKESYIKQILDKDGNLDLNEFDREFDMFEVSSDSVEVYIASKNVSLSLYIKEQEVK